MKANIPSLGTLLAIVLFDMILFSCSQNNLLDELREEAGFRKSFIVTYVAEAPATGSVPTDSTVYYEGEYVQILGDSDLLSIPGTVDRPFIYWNSESDGSGTIYFPGTTFEGEGEDVTLFAQFIGDPGPGGGYVYYHDKDATFPGWDYLEAAQTDQSTGMEWSNIEQPAISSTSMDIGSGPDNTDKIINQDDHTNSAAQACRNIGAAWFLPSMDELNMMYENLHRNGIGSFDASDYWTSTEPIPNYAPGWAYFQSFGSGGQHVAEKYSSRRVRASIRF